ncbi:unnamed protein product [Soboliphyme baturini]|uniref:BTB/POZ domain-containing protein n=1 Tax=Soboliphyme baturini TaxID=241478 RepID=A0A183IEA8_9BILA|nr:unnamed protein product [Soboliphyme baturini]
MAEGVENCNGLLTLAKYNCSSTLGEAWFQELEVELGKINWDVELGEMKISCYGVRMDTSCSADGQQMDQCVTKADRKSEGRTFAFHKFVRLVDDVYSSALFRSITTPMSQGSSPVPPVTSTEAMTRADNYGGRRPAI